MMIALIIQGRGTGKTNYIQETSPQAVDENNTMEVQEKILDRDGSLPEGQCTVQHCNESNINPSRGDPECPDDEQNEKVNQDTASSNKPRDKWEEGLNKERNSNERIQRQKDKGLVYLRRSSLRCR